MTLSQLLATSLAQVSIKFNPVHTDLEAQELRCEEDLAVCNRECERLFSDRVREMEEPCKLAVANKFGVGSGGASCFPAEARVEERHRGHIPIKDVQVGDTLAAERGALGSRVVALLHADPERVELYLLLRMETGGELAISPQHLVRARRRGGWSRARSPGDVAAASSEGQWAWVPAEDVRPGDELEDAAGAAVAIRGSARALLRGAFAPLTASGELLVAGVRCSCYAPPVDWQVPHLACHAAMLPLRALDAARALVERWSRPESDQDPLLTVEALWLLPSAGDATVHPWASGLLRAVGAAEAIGLRLPGARPEAKAIQPAAEKVWQAP